MKKLYTFYCDESGGFNNIDTHVIAPLIVRDDVVSFQDIGEIWKEIYPLPWNEFHMSHLLKEQKQKIFREIADKILCLDNCYTAYVYHKNEKKFGFDFYLGVVFHLLLWECENILHKEAQKIVVDCEKDKTFRIEIKIYLAERKIINNRAFQKTLQEEMKQKVRELVEDGKLLPNQLSFNFRPFLLPVSDSPYLQISDALCNTIRAYHNDASFLDDRCNKIIRDLKSIELSENQIDNEEIRALCHKLVNPSNASTKIIIKKEKIVEKEVVKYVKTPKPKIQRSHSEALLKKIRKLKKKGKEIRNRDIDNDIVKISEQPAFFRMADFEFLFTEAYQSIRTERNYAIGERLVHLLYTLLDSEHKDEEISIELLDEKELKIADLYLTVNNHLGNYLLEDPKIQKALKLSEKFKSQWSKWNDICSFRNHLVVALQNVFSLDKAIENLYPLIEYFLQEQKNPFFKDEAVKAYEIGALFGTYAQAVAFSTHCRFFKQGLRAFDNFEDTELYSMMACDHFEKEKDLEQQVTYQAHFKMQRYILLGEKNALQEAFSILDTDGRNNDAIEVFLLFFPDVKSLIPVYRVAALLKQAYLSGNILYWLNNLIEAFLKHSNSIPASHPMEQILPYMILLCQEDSSKRTKLLNIFHQIPFPKNIVETIKEIMGAQVEYVQKQKCSESSIKAIQASITENIKPQWKRYGLDEVLKGYLKPNRIDRWHVGPMEVLPFNYS
jgi:hypothetical protein